MTRFAIDAATAVRIARERTPISPAHQLVAPNLLRSQALSQIYRAERAGQLGASEARAALDGITAMRIRLLGDRVSRGTAYRLAQQLDWDDTVDAEYVAVAQLQADAFITLDSQLARKVLHLVTVAPFEALLNG